MKEHLRNETVRRPVLVVLEGDPAVDEALALRADQPRLARRCAERVERARPGGEEVLAHLASRPGAQVPPPGKAA
jgi:hypothetical protein